MEIGAIGTVRATVTEDDTAVALGSGDVPVLGTPRVVALLEAAAVAALGDPGTGRTSVGTEIDVRHLAPSAVGATVVATAEIVGIEGRSVRFRVTLEDDGEIVAAGHHTRVIVDRDRFLASLR